MVVAISCPFTKSRIRVSTFTELISLNFFLRSICLEKYILFETVYAREKEFYPLTQYVFEDFPGYVHFIPYAYSVPSRISWLAWRIPRISNARFRIIVTVGAVTCIISAISLTENPCIVYQA